MPPNALTVSQLSASEKAKAAFAKYCNDFPQFETSRECDFCKKLLVVCEDEDANFEENFATIFVEYEKISKFSTWVFIYFILFL